MDGFQQTIPQPQTPQPHQGGMPQMPPPGGGPGGPAPGQLPSFGPPPEQGAQGRRPPGRPSLDPDREAARRQTAQERERLLRLLPKAATDARILVYKGKGPRGMQHFPTPVLRILMSDIEDSGDEPHSFIEGKIQEKFPDGGHFVCEPKDKSNRPIPDASAFDLDIAADDGTFPHLEDIEDEDEELEVIEDYDDSFSPNSLSSMRPPPQGRAQIPGFSDDQAAWRPPGSGAPPVIKEDPLSSYKAIKEMVKQEQSDSGSMMHLWMQMEAARREDDRRREEARRQEEIRREELQRQLEERRERERRQDEERERLRQEEARREERERRENVWKAVIAGIPAALTVVAKMTEKKEDTMLPILLKMMDNSNDRSAVKDMISLTNESAKQQMGLQSELTKSMLETQGQASSSMLNNVMTMMMQASQAQIEAMGGESEDWTDKMGKIMKIVSPVIEGISQQSGQVPQMPGMRVAPAVEQAVSGDRHAQQQEQAQEAPQLTDAQATRAVLHTIRSLENGDQQFLDGATRLQALQWIAENLPEDIREAVQSGHEETVIELCTPVVMADADLRVWLFEDGVGDFVRAVLGQVRGILEGRKDQIDALRALYFHRAHLRSKGVEMALPPEVDLDAALAEAEALARQQGEEPATADEVEETQEATPVEGSRIEMTGGPNQGAVGEVLAVLEGGYHVRLEDGQEVPALPEHLEVIGDVPQDEEDGEDEEDPAPRRAPPARRPAPPPPRKEEPVEEEPVEEEPAVEEAGQQEEQTEGEDAS